MGVEQCGTGKLPGNGQGKHDSERSAGGGAAGETKLQEQTKSINDRFKQTSEPGSTAQLEGIGRQAEAFWDRAGNLPGIPATAQERFARFLPGEAMNNLANARRGKLKDGTIRALFGDEGAVSRSSLNASRDRQKMGQAGTQVERWAKTVGATGWHKATPRQRALIAQRLAPDELRAIGVETK